MLAHVRLNNINYVVCNTAQRCNERRRGANNQCQEVAGSNQCRRRDGCSAHLPQRDPDGAQSVNRATSIAENSFYCLPRHLTNVKIDENA